MAIIFHNHAFSAILSMIILNSFVFFERFHCFNPKLLNVSKSVEPLIDHNWYSAGATWYGSPDGAGSDGGACGYLDAVQRPPFSSMISAGDPSIYQAGLGCGVCYSVKCTDNAACSGNPVIVTITDECPGCSSPHFDLSGTAFGALANPGQAHQLRNAGVLQVQYTEVKCNYPGVTMAVRVDPGSNPYYLAVAIEYEDGFGIEKVELQQQSGDWITMELGHGAVWVLNAGYVLQAPFSLRLTEEQTHKTIVLDKVIPAGWQAGQTYRSNVNFDV